MFKAMLTVLLLTSGLIIIQALEASLSDYAFQTSAGNVVLAGEGIFNRDQNLNNKQTTTMDASTQLLTTQLIEIGNGTSFQRQPFGTFFGYERSATLYKSNELGFCYGQVTAIKWFCNSSYTVTTPYKIYLKTVSQNSLSACTWSSMISGATMMQNSTYTFNQAGWVTFNFTNSFNYDAGNLLVMVETNIGGSTNVPYNSFRYTEGETNTHQYWQSPNSSPPTGNGTTNNQRPNIGIFIQTQNMGTLEGHVSSGGQPLAGATVTAGQYSTISAAEGAYNLPALVPGIYSDVTCSKTGYLSQSQIANIVINQITTLNFNLVPIPLVMVTGQIVGSNTAGQGIENAAITLSGMVSYSAMSNEHGFFSISGVYANQTYDYTIVHTGYSPTTGTIAIGITDYNMGVLMLNENAYPVPGIQVVEIENNVLLQWTPPHPPPPPPPPTNISESFEGTEFPPFDWVQAIVNDGPANHHGILPTWCRFGTPPGIFPPVVPPDGDWQIGVGFTDVAAHQDEWLFSPQFVCPDSAWLVFQSYVYFGSTYGDHYYVKISTDFGDTWTVLWDASAIPGGAYHNYTHEPISISLLDYAAQNIKLAWHAQDPPDSLGLMYTWFIDDVNVNNPAQTLSFPFDEVKTSGISEFSAYANRNLSGYILWRFLEGDEGNEASWTLLTSDILDSTSFYDTGWFSIPNGIYKWAVKAVYGGTVHSYPTFSGSLEKLAQAGTLTGFVRNSANQPVMGATITVGDSTAYSDDTGAFTISITAGFYAVTCSAPNYNPQTLQNIVINENQTTTQNFVLTLTDNIDPVNAGATVLKGVYPNPFTLETTISYSLKKPAPVEIKIYNTKGQLIRTLVNEVKGKGNHLTSWNVKDDANLDVESGVYFFRMKSDKYFVTRKMVLIK